MTTYWNRRRRLEPHVNNALIVHSICHLRLPGKRTTSTAFVQGNRIQLRHKGIHGICKTSLPDPCNVGTKEIETWLDKPIIGEVMDLIDVSEWTWAGAALQKQVSVEALGPCPFHAHMMLVAG